MNNNKKFKPGDSVYVVMNEATMHNKGDVQKFSVRGPYEVNEVVTWIGINNSKKFRYRLKCSDTRCTERDAYSIFATAEEAQAECDRLNIPRIRVDLKDIFITDEYKNSYPSVDKIYKKFTAFMQHGYQFKDDIKVDADMTLTDGYIQYLIYKMINRKTCNVVVNNHVEDPTTTTIIPDGTLVRIDNTLSGTIIAHKIDEDGKDIYWVIPLGATLRNYICVEPGDISYIEDNQLVAYDLSLEGLREIKVLDHDKNKVISCKIVDSYTVGVGSWRYYYAVPEGNELSDFIVIDHGRYSIINMGL